MFQIYLIRTRTQDPRHQSPAYGRLKSHSNILYTHPPATPSCSLVSSTFTDFLCYLVLLDFHSPIFVIHLMTAVSVQPKRRDSLKIRNNS